MKEVSNLSRHYPALLENGIVSDEFAINNIIPDVLSNMIDLDLSSNILEILKSNNSDAVYNWEQIINYNKKLSNDFIDKLIITYENIIKDKEKFKQNKNLEKHNEIVINSNKNFNISNGIYFVDNKISKINDYISNYNITNIEKNENSSDDNSGEEKDAKEYLEEARKLSRKMKKNRYS